MKQLPAVAGLGTGIGTDGWFMDRPIVKKFWNARRVGALGIAGLAILTMGFLFSYTGKQKSEFNISTDRLMIASVKNGDFREFIPVDGIVQPIKVIYLDAIEGGRITERYVQDGDMVKQGQPLLRLVNTDLQLDFLNRETQAFDLINNLQNTRNNLENNKVNRLTQLAEVDFQLKEAARLYEVNKKLLKDEMISQQEFLQSENNFLFSQKKKQLIERAIVQDSLTAYEQMKQMRESYTRMQKNLQLMRQKTEDLVVLAPASGQLSSFRAEVGELKNKGQSLGQLDILDGYKVRAQVDEHYVSRIGMGQKAEFEFAGKTYALVVKTIYPQVSNGRFEADMEFEGRAPEAIKKGQTVQLKMQMGSPGRCLLVQRGGFYQSGGGHWAFVLNEERTFAEKRDIVLGRQNPDYYEVISGLKEGEEVIISSYETFQSYNRINLK